MTKVTLTGTFASGYTLSAGQTYVSISSTGYLQGTGLVGPAGVPAYHVVNEGRINSTADGVLLNSPNPGAYTYVINGGLDNTAASVIAASTGIEVTAPAQVLNFGTVRGAGRSSDGVYLESDGTVINGAASDTAATIYAVNEGIRIVTDGEVINFGAITGAANAGIDVVGGGGLVINGSASDTTASVRGGVGVFMGTNLAGTGQGTVTNFGTIVGDGVGSARTYYGALFQIGGNVTNGSAVDQTALIEGECGVGIQGTSGQVTNFGTIAGLGGVGDYGVVLLQGGGLINGRGADTRATISGYGGVLLGGAATVTNVGVIHAAGGAGVLNQAGGATVTNLGAIVSGGAYGVRLAAGGSVINGSATRRAARIEGYGGVYINVGGTVTNFGSIVSVGGSNAVFCAEGDVVNGGGLDTTALIEGVSGVQVFGTGSVRNLGTILGDYGVGVQINTFGAITNGSLSNATALIKGFGIGASILHGAVANFGTIQGVGAYGFGLFGGETVTNGALGHSAALIVGDTGLSEVGAATVTNYGTIAGNRGNAVYFDSIADTLRVEAGCRFIGQVLGGGGTLDLASGTGMLKGVFTAGGNVSVSGAIAATTFTNFGTLEVDVGASFTVSGAGAVGAAQSLVVLGTLSAAGVISSAGTVTLGGLLAGAGTLALTGGTATIGAGTTLSIAHVTMASGATAAFTGNINDAKVWTQSGGTLSVSSGNVVGFSGAGDSFAGTLSGAGSVAFTGGSDTLTGAILSVASASISGAKVTLSGNITLAHTLSVATPNLIVGAAGVTLKGGGVLALSNSAANRIYGATAGATLINAGVTITGAGLLGNGSMALNNAAGGAIKGNAATALTIDIGANTISNSGLIEATGTGGLVIQSAIANTGTLGAIGGKLTVNGAVSGAGSLKINGGVADMTSTFVEKVTFTGATGVLELAHGQKYTGSISGFSHAGTTSLDLDDIAFAAGTTKATYSGTGTSGTLTVTDGAHTAKIKFTGDYTGSSWVLAADGHGGTIIHDPAAGSHVVTGAPATGVAALHRFTAAAAGLSGRSGAAATGFEPATGPPALLFAPGPRGGR